MPTTLALFSAQTFEQGITNQAWGFSAKLRCSLACLPQHLRNRRGGRRKGRAHNRHDRTRDRHRDGPEGEARETHVELSPADLVEQLSVGMSEYLPNQEFELDDKLLAQVAWWNAIQSQSWIAQKLQAEGLLEEMDCSLLELCSETRLLAPSGSTRSLEQHYSNECHRWVMMVS